LRALVLVVSLAGCGVGPAYQRPEVVAPAAFRADSPAGAAVWPAPEWWRGFDSPVLDELMAKATAGNFDIAAAVARIRQADAALVVAGAPLLPTFTATPEDQWAHTSISRASSGRSGSVTSYEYRSYSGTLAASYEIDLWGRLRALRAAALGNALFSRYDRETVALTVVASVATTWFEALASQDRLDVARRNLNDAESILAAIRARLEVGTASALDIAQQEALVAGLRTQIPALESQLAQQRNGLGILTGQLPEAIAVPAGSLTSLSLPEVAPGLPSGLLARRPDVAAAEAQLVAQNGNIRAARAALFPQVTLTASGGWQAYTLATLFGPGSAFATAALSAAQTVFDNAARSGQLAEAKGRYDELLADYRKAVVQAFTDVENALAAYRFATEQEALERQAVEAAQRAADIARAQLLAGTIDIVTTLQAETTLFTDLDLLAQVRLARFTALVNLYQALGGGWTASDISAPSPRLLQGVL
jgi:NodT family efflux transporter outer membrane factor (OMF) lipoprotein